MMTKRRQVKLLKEGKYIAQVDLELIYTDEDWSPYLSLDDALKLDEVRDALRKGDLQLASKYARIYELTPVAIAA
ncbi:MAG: hypothetical protein JXA42_04550 [Anaerolineales bacterium]|nr:hypothetical protein [Anaerolineales bacterium]